MTTTRLDRRLPAVLLVLALMAGPWNGLAAAGERDQTAPPPGDAAPSEPLLRSAAAAGFNLLLVTMDTTRADRVGCYGNAAAQTPSLDALAARGVRYELAYATAPMTSPSHASLLTGLYPPRHGVRSNGEQRLGAEATTAAEILAQHGYRTAAFVSCFVLDAQFGLNQGFATYDSTPDHRGGHFERSATAVTDAAIGFLSQARGDQPSFLWVHYFDPHFPYAPPAPWAQRFADDPYAGEIAYMDAELGRLLAAVEASDSKARTLVVVVGDHGEGLGEHFEDFHSRTIYDAAVRVPLILAAPGAVASGRVDDAAVVSVVDVLPTVLDLLGVSGQARAFDGISLVAPDRAPSRVVYVETLGTYLSNSWAPLYGACRRGEKYILAPRPELYDLRQDPRELVNLLEPGRAELPAAAGELRAFLDGYLADKPSAAAVAAGALPVDAAARARLEALGYTVGTSPTGAEATAPDPKDMMPLLHLLGDSRGLLDSGRPQQAIEALQAILAKAPRDRAALTLVAEGFTQLGRYAEAEQALRARLEARPEAFGAAMLADVIALQGRFDDAAAILLEAGRREPDAAMVPFARGELLMKQGRPREAVAFYQEAARKDPVRFADQAEARLQAARRMVEQELPRPE